MSPLLYPPLCPNFYTKFHFHFNQNCNPNWTNFPSPIFAQNKMHPCLQCAHIICERSLSFTDATLQPSNSLFNYYYRSFLLTPFSSFRSCLQRYYFPSVSFEVKEVHFEFKFLQIYSLCSFIALFCSPFLNNSISNVCAPARQFPDKIKLHEPWK